MYFLTLALTTLVCREINALCLCQCPQGTYSPLSLSLAYILIQLLKVINYKLFYSLHSTFLVGDYRLVSSKSSEYGTKDHPGQTNLKFDRYYVKYKNYYRLQPYTNTS